MGAGLRSLGGGLGSLGLAGLFALGLLWPGAASAQTVVTPPSLVFDVTSLLCAKGAQDEEVCLSRGAAVVDRVDVCFLFDDTGSFAGTVPTVAAIFSQLASDLRTALPGVDFGFCVARFEDYGGPGNDFSNDTNQARPFVLNQPVVNAADAGGDAALDALISAALMRTARGGGGDGPETAIEGLAQLATGAGFDGDGDLDTTGADGTQVAGALATQTAADTSGDVPAFATLDAGVVSSGSLGGAGWRGNSLRLVILATDVCSVSVFDSAAGIPAEVDGTGGSELVEEFACNSTTPGDSRFGFEADAKSEAANTVAGAVAPQGAFTVQETLDAMNGLGIRLLGLAPGGGPVAAGNGPDFSPSTFLSALARLTGAVDEMGDPLVFDTSGGGDPLRAAIVSAIETTVTLPIDISLVPNAAIGALDVSILPGVVPGVGPGQEACFDVSFTSLDTPGGSFDLEFTDVGSNAVIDAVPVDVFCSGDTVLIDFDDVETVAFQAPVPVAPDRYEPLGVHLSTTTGVGLFAFHATSFVTNTPPNYLFSNTVDEPGACQLPSAGCNALGDIVIEFLTRDDGESVPGVTDKVSFYMADGNTGAGAPWTARIFDLDGNQLDQIVGNSNDEIEIPFERDQKDIHRAVFTPFDGMVGASAGIDSLSFTRPMRAAGDARGDFNGDGFIGGPDFDVFLMCFNMATGPGVGPPDDPNCEETDLNGDGFVGGPDFDEFLLLFPGPVPSAASRKASASVPSAAAAAATAAVSGPIPDPTADEEEVPSACGLGFELALWLPAVALARRRLCGR